MSRPTSAMRCPAALAGSGPASARLGLGRRFFPAAESQEMDEREVQKNNGIRWVGICFVARVVLESHGTLHPFSYQILAIFVAL